MADLDKFEDYLRNNTTLLEGSIAKYVRTLKFFFSKFQEPSVDNFNIFITTGFRKSRSNYLRYAVKYFLLFDNRGSEYIKIVKTRIRPKKKLGTYLTKEKILELINSIAFEKYRDVARLQFALGARAREILTLQEENLDFSGQEIKVKLTGKGDKARTMYLLKDFEPLLKKYCTLGIGFIFIPKEFSQLDAKVFEVKVNSERTRYYNHIKKVASEFGTHDFRRNVAELLKQSGKDLYIIKEVLGHSSLAVTEKYFKQNSEQTKAAILEIQK
jgi:integrase